MSCGREGKWDGYYTRTYIRGQYIELPQDKKEEKKPQAPTYDVYLIEKIQDNAIAFNPEIYRWAYAIETSDMNPVTTISLDAISNQRTSNYDIYTGHKLLSIPQKEFKSLEPLKSALNTYDSWKDRELFRSRAPHVGLYLHLKEYLQSKNHTVIQSEWGDSYEKMANGTRSKFFEEKQQQERLREEKRLEKEKRRRKEERLREEARMKEREKMLEERLREEKKLKEMKKLEEERILEQERIRREEWKRQDEWQREAIRLEKGKGLREEKGLKGERIWKGDSERLGSGKEKRVMGRQERYMDPRQEKGSSRALEMRPERPEPSKSGHTHKEKHHGPSRPTSKADSNHKSSKQSNHTSNPTTKTPNKKSYGREDGEKKKKRG